MGLNVFEPLTSPLSGVRSNQLSYRPKSTDNQKEPRPTRPKGWWAWVDSNYRPHPYQGCALTN